MDAQAELGHDRGRPSQRHPEKARNPDNPIPRKPDWLRVKAPVSPEYQATRRLIREFALKKPVFRIVANTQSSMGATGYTTGLAPSMSLGCGAYAGNITSDNITPLHLINVKRLAYEITGP